MASSSASKPRGGVRARNSARSPVASSRKPSLGLRLKAWWHGYDLQPRAANAGGQGAAASQPRVEPLPPPHEIGWDAHRIRLVQDVWGDGCYGPRAIEEAVELVAPCCLDSTMRLLDFGAGLGGPTREVARRFGVWVTGLEKEPLLAEEATAQAREDGFAKKAPVASFDPAKFETTPDHYECVLSRHAVHAMPDKAAALRQLARTLKPGGHLVMIDYVLGDGVDPEAVGDFALMEGAPPVGLEVYKDTLTQSELDLRIAVDISEDHIAQIKEGWFGFLGKVEKEEAEVTSLAALSAESARWMGRLEHLQSGRLRCFRFHAIRPS